MRTHTEITGTSHAKTLLRIGLTSQQILFQFIEKFENAYRETNVMREFFANDTRENF